LGLTTPVSPSEPRQITIGKAEIRELIPHAGTMCLLDGVIEWNDDSIVCVTETHRDAENPLRRNGGLSAVHAFEYGAQAAAVHGGLRARAEGATAPPGYLAALRDAQLHIERLDVIASPLQVQAKRLFGEAANTVYDCRVLADGTLLAQARVTIIPRT
jgi:predicted hotdog family 3-hydroxylacyl-ACP dehydratase